MKKPLLLLIVLSITSSCISNKRVEYFQDDVPFNAKLVGTIATENMEYVLNSGDIIDIRINSKNSELTKLFELKNQGGQNMQGQLPLQGGDPLYSLGYSIDNFGFIELPLVGKIQIGQKTLIEAEGLITEKIREYIKDAFIMIQLGGIRFSALGEFKLVGQRLARVNSLNIYEALALVGDMTLIADRKNVLLLRKNDNNQEVYEIDLTSKDIINSEFYFIQPNDVLYARPLKRRAIGTGQNGVSTFSTILGTVSTALAFYLAFRNN